MDHEKNGQAEAKPGLFLNIPLEIAGRDDVTTCAKMAYGMINMLCRVNSGLCTSSNEHLADSIGVCTKSLKAALTLLVKKNLVRRVMHGQYRESLSIVGLGGGDGGHESPRKPSKSGGQGSPEVGKKFPHHVGKETPHHMEKETPHHMGKNSPQGWGRNFPTMGKKLPHHGEEVSPEVGKKFPPLENLEGGETHQRVSPPHADAREASAGPSAREAPGPASAKRKKPGKTGAEIEAERRAMDASMRETRRVEQHIADLSKAPMDDPIIRREMEARAAGEMAVLLPDPAIAPPVEIVRPHVIAMRAALEARKAGGQ